MDYIWLLRF